MGDSQYNAIWSNGVKNAECLTLIIFIKKFLPAMYIYSKQLQVIYQGTQNIAEVAVGNIKIF